MSASSDEKPRPELYKPWEEPWFIEIITQIVPYTLVPPERLYTLYTLATQATNLGGHWYECGVFRGGTALLLARIAAARRIKLFLFDSFEGLPAPDPSMDDHKQGDFSGTSETHIRDLMATMAPRARVEIRPGFIPDSFENLPSDGLSFAHVDVDLYTSTMDCLEWIYLRMLPGGFLVCDDYGFPQCKGARQAVDEFFEDFPEEPLALGTGQAVVIKL